jgi:cytochrome b561
LREPRPRLAPAAWSCVQVAVFPTFQAYALLATLPAILIAASLFHQFVLKDSLFRRMWFGRRTIVPAEK